MWFTFKQFSETLIDELENASDRTIGVAVGAMVDSCLTDALRTELHRDDTEFTKHVRTNLFSPDGALGTFSAKIQLAYLLAYFTPEGYDDLQNLKNIRNLFAHFMEHNSFSTQRVKDKCANFKLVDKRIRRPAVHSSSRTGTFALDSVTLARNTVFLNLKDCEQAISSPRGRFVATAKLFVAAFELYAAHNSELKKPIF